MQANPILVDAEKYTRSVNNFLRSEDHEDRKDFDTIVGTHEFF